MKIRVLQGSCMDNRSNAQEMRTTARLLLADRRRSPLFLVLLLLSSVWISCDAPVKVGLIGDQFGAVNADSAYAVMDKAVLRLQQQQPDVVVQVGDMLESIRNIDSYEAYQKNWRTAASIMDQVKRPWFLAFGDHDVVPPEYQPLSGDRSREKWALQLARLQGLPVDSLPYYGVSIKGYHFIFLYSLENLHTDPRWGSIFLNSISDRQMKWLERELDTHQHAKGIIVILHHPHWYVWSNWYRIHELLRRYPVKAVIAGHYHYSQDEGILDGIHYYVMGSTGGVINDTDPNSGGTFVYGLMTLSQKTPPRFLLRSVRSDSVIAVPSRRSMDRIQAVECMLDGLWQDENIVLRQGKLFDRNGDKLTSLHGIGLESIANPIDVPISIVIEYDTTLIAAARWNAGPVPLDGRAKLELKPGLGMGWANYSNVGKLDKSKPVWEADLRPENRYTLKSITLNVFVSFRDDRERRVHRTITYGIN
ncbi:MAG TPA: metallophosphoesterase [bacterium]|nr:metallophosphoesterase [bacterium]